MKDLGDRMRAIAEDPPPTTIDVDRVIISEQRRARNIRAVTAVACSVAVVVLSTVLIPGVRAGLIPITDTGVGSERTTSPAVTKQPTPAASMAEPSVVETSPSQSPLGCGVSTRAPGGFPASRDSSHALVTADRLSNAMEKMLLSQLRGLKIRDLAHDADCEGQQFVFDSRRGAYRLELEVVSQSGTGTLTITIMPRPEDELSALCVGSEECKVARSGDGGLYTTATARGDSGVLRYFVNFSRVDGTFIVMETSNVAAAQRHVPLQKLPPLSIDELLGLSESPYLTLYP